MPVRRPSLPRARCRVCRKLVPCFLGKHREEQDVGDTGGTQSEPPEQIPAGWYPDEADSAIQRWWSGEGWTEHTRATPQSAPPLLEGAPQTAEVDAASLVSDMQSASERPKWMVPVVVAAIAVVVIAVGVILAITITNAVATAQKEAEEQAAAEAAAAAEVARLELLPDAVKSCGLTASIVQDGGTSAFLDNEGDDYGSGDLSVSDLVCVLTALDTPDAVINHMSNTRSLDGTQSDTWNDFSATWTYHPDDGLDVIIKLTE